MVIIDLNPITDEMMLCMFMFKVESPKFSKEKTKKLSFKFVVDVGDGKDTKCDIYQMLWHLADDEINTIKYYKNRDSIEYDQFLLNIIKTKMNLFYIFKKSIGDLIPFEIYNFLHKDFYLQKRLEDNIKNRLGF